MKNFTFIIVSLAAAVALNSCNTFIGVTRDLQSLGNGLENKANGRTWKAE